MLYHTDRKFRVYKKIYVSVFKLLKCTFIRSNVYLYNNSRSPLYGNSEASYLNTRTI